MMASPRNAQRRGVACLPPAITATPLRVEEALLPPRAGTARPRRAGAVEVGSLPMARPRISGDAWTRTLIALVVVGAALVSIVVISGVAIALADDASETSRLVFTSVLPLLGTWVGTVLAFYFARENLEAATDSTLALAGKTDTPVTKVMIREGDILAHDLAANQDPKTVKLSAVRDTMAKMKPPGRRVPIRDVNRVV